MQKPNRPHPNLHSLFESELIDYIEKLEAYIKHINNVDKSWEDRLIEEGAKKYKTWPHSKDDCLMKNDIKELKPNQIVKKESTWNSFKNIWTKLESWVFG